MGMSANKPVEKELKSCSLSDVCDDMTADIRVVVVYVDAMRHGLLQREEVNWLPLQYICGGCEELVKTPTPLLTLAVAP
ncbi:hypothetical protein EYF80_026481 [Liparis tanakae]|uniref:Uncharacterized protein n=1 Tax=Liparis tanakae TaxID=230148 RepID=A0A4Z2HDG9_9TELE|nr:hypothetical protein EYF80_026481 [Liparis tanakae]